MIASTMRGAKEGGKGVGIDDLVVSMLTLAQGKQGCGLGWLEKAHSSLFSSAYVLLRTLLGGVLFQPSLHVQNT